MYKHSTFRCQVRLQLGYSLRCIHAKFALDLPLVALFGFKLTSVAKRLIQNDGRLGLGI